MGGVRWRCAGRGDSDSSLVEVVHRFLVRLTATHRPTGVVVLLRVDVAGVHPAWPLHSPWPHRPLCSLGREVRLAVQGVPLAATSPLIKPQVQIGLLAMARTTGRCDRLRWMAGGAVGRLPGWPPHELVA